MQQKKHLSEGDIDTTSAGMLNCKNIIHALGPQWKGGSFGEEESLFAVIDGCFSETQKHKLRSIAIPPVSSGKSGFPLALAVATIVGATSKRETSKGFLPKLVIFIDNKDDSLQLFEQELRQRFDQPSAKSSASETEQGIFGILLLYCGLHMVA